MQIDQILQKAVSNKKVPGLVAIAANDDGVIYQGAFGQRGVETDMPMSLDTVFWIASMTKAITSVAALQQVEKGKIQLDEPIKRVLPELESAKVLEGFDSQGQPKLRPAKRPITLRHLLTHTAGFSYPMYNANTGRYMEWAKIPDILECRNATLQIPLVHDPGERWEYGINMEWVGKTVEAVSGQSLPEYIKEHISAPLGMNDTDFILRPDIRSRLVAMHKRHPNGELHQIPPIETPENPEFYLGGGGIYTTAEDFIKFLQALLHRGSFNGVRILEPKTVSQMEINQVGDINIGVVRSFFPFESNDVEFYPGMVKKWSLSHMITTEEAPTGRSAGSLAWGGVANTFYWIDPVKRVTGVFMTQLFPFMDEAVLQAFADFEKGVYNSLKVIQGNKRFF